MHNRKRHFDDTDEQKADPIKRQKLEKDYEDVFTVIDAEQKTYEERLSSHRSLIANQIQEFYSDSFQIIDSNRKDVENCIILFCKEFPNEAGKILQRNVAKTQKEKADISLMLLKAGANGNERENEYESYSFEIAITHNAPQELIDLFIAKQFAPLRLQFIEALYYEKCEIGEAIKPRVKNWVQRICQWNPIETGKILNRNIHKTAKYELSYWLMEFGADLKVKPHYRYSTFYYAVTANLPAGIYDFFRKAGITETGVNVISSSIFGPDAYRYPLSPLLLAALSGSDSLYYFKHQYRDEFRKLPYTLINSNFELFKLGDSENERLVKQSEINETRVKLWMASKKDIRVKTLDRIIIATAFAPLSTIGPCLTLFELFSKHIPHKREMIAAVGKCLQIYTPLIDELLDIAGAKICAVLEGSYQNHQERVAACELVMKHPFYSFKHDKDWQSKIAKMRDTAFAASLSLEQKEHPATPSRKHS